MFQSAGWTAGAIYPDTSTPTFNIDHIFEWYEPGSFTAAPMLSNTTAIATRTVATDFGSGYAWNYTSAGFTTPVSLGTRVNVWVAIKAVDPTTGNRIADGNTALVQPTGETAVNYGIWLGRVGLPCVGSTTEDWGRDQNPNGTVGAPGDFAGGSTWLGNVPGSPNDRRRSAASFAAGARVHTLGMRGDVVAPAPATAFQLCNIADGNTAQSVTVPANGVVWGQICTTGPVTDDLLRFLNIDTEGSVDDLAIALYDNGGALLASDDDSGSGTAAQMSFGLGRGAAVGDGSQYDGRDGQLTAAGTFYVAIGPVGTSFSGAFTVVPGTGGGSSNTVNFGTNVNAGGGLPTAVEPVINHFDLTTLGPAWTYPAADTFQGTTGDGNPNPNDDNSSAVLWTKFAIEDMGSSGYLDIDFGTSDYGDNIAYLFNSSGDLISFSDDQLATVNFLPLMSYGATNPPRSTGTGQTRAVANSGSVTWAGQNGLLAPGTYFLAQAAWPADVMTGQGGAAPTPGTARRWHVRGLSGNNIGFTSEFYTGTGQACDSIDFNNDGLFPDTLDIDDFLSVFSGGPCSNDPSCGDIDYNNDGLFPDTLDIDALLSVFSGGPCLL